MDEDEIMMAALGAGRRDFVAQDDAFEIFTTPEDFSRRVKPETAGYEFIRRSDMVPQNTVSITDRRRGKGSAPDRQS